jgi:hypothetical protein
MGESMKTEFKNGDPVIRDDDGKEYTFIGMSRSGVLENNRGEKLDCVIERNNFVSYAITSHLKLKPETVTHPGGEYPKHCDDAEAILSAESFYSPGFVFENDGRVVPYAGVGRVADQSRARILAQTGLIHLSKEAAIAHAKVIYQIED